MIEDRYDQQRGCGWRKEKGLYLIGGSLMAHCGKLPIPLTVCPCCNVGIKATRGFTWVGKALVMASPCRTEELNAETCRHCPPFDGSQEKLGLVWIGGSFYKTPEDFLREAREQGISRRIPAVPNDFIVGESWVLLAHREGMLNPDKGENSLLNIPDKIPAIISSFCPTHIEYIVSGEETDDEIKKMEKRGLTCVRVHKTGQDSGKLFTDEDE